MEQIVEYASYPVGPGDKYLLELTPEFSSVGPDLTVIVQVLDGRPGVAASNPRVITGPKVHVDAVTFREGTPMQVFGRFVNDGTQFWQITKLWKTSTGGRVKATIAGFTDSILDPIESRVRAGKQTVTDTVRTVGRIAIPTTVVFGAVALAVFLGRLRG